MRIFLACRVKQDISSVYTHILKSGEGWRYENYSQIMIVYFLKFHTKISIEKLENIVL